MTRYPGNLSITSEIMRRMNTLSSTTSTVAIRSPGLDLDTSPSLSRDANATVREIEVERATIVTTDIFCDDLDAVVRKRGPRCHNIALTDVDSVGGHQILKHAGATDEPSRDSVPFRAHRFQLVQQSWNRRGGKAPSALRIRRRARTWQENVRHATHSGRLVVQDYGDAGTEPEDGKNTACFANAALTRQDEVTQPFGISSPARRRL
jgi:hypothetical protein